MRSIEREFFLGFIKIHVLHHASREPVYGLWLIEELARHGYRLSPGTLYPILRSMEERGFLRSRREVVEGKVRRYYRITGKGKRALHASLEKIRELVGEVLDGEEEKDQR